MRERESEEREREKIFDNKILQEMISMILNQRWKLENFLNIYR